ncbi:MAG: ribonuclease J [Deltaproteobacteria bacterium]|nr:ribonuclease J [Deltaproteobacteria bacterium]
MAENFIKAIGGYGEFGANCTLISVNGHGVVIDSGVKFSGNDFDGIEKLLPDFSLIESEEDTIIDAVIITHAHEDHIGAIDALMTNLKCPVYCTYYTINLVRYKLDEAKIHRKIIPVQEGKKYSVNKAISFNVYEMEHSIPDSCSIRMEIEEFSFFISGDFRNGSKFPGFADDKMSVDFMFCDSTASMEFHEGPQEEMILESFTKILRESSGRVFFTLFSSNIDRLNLILKAAEFTERKVALIGRGLKTHFYNAVERGFLPLTEHLPPEMVSSYPQSRQVFVISGSQAELFSTLNRLSLQTFNDFKIVPDDTVVFSSRAIPGREVAISRMCDRILKLGAKIVDSLNNIPLHSSGHGNRLDITDLINSVNPGIFIPHHGSYRHMCEAAKIADKQGVQDTVIIENSDKIVFSDSEFSILKGEGSTPVIIDTPSGSILSTRHLKERRKIAAKGIAVVSYYRLKNSISVNFEFAGIGNPEVDVLLKESVERKLIKNYDPLMKRERLTELSRQTVSEIFKKIYGKKPFVIVMIKDKEEK